MPIVSSSKISEQLTNKLIHLLSNKESLPKRSRVPSPSWTSSRIRVARYLRDQAPFYLSSKGPDLCKNRQLTNFSPARIEAIHKDLDHMLRLLCSKNLSYTKISHKSKVCRSNSYRSKCLSRIRFKAKQGADGWSNTMAIITLAWCHPQILSWTKARCPTNNNSPSVCFNN